MRLHGSSPPQGKDKNRSLLFSLLPPHIQYGAPSDVSVIPANWFDTDFKSRISITINASQVPSAQTDFPFLLNSTISDLIGRLQSAGEDVRFALQDKTELKYEIQAVDEPTGDITVWTKVPSISNGLKFFIYFNNPGASDNQDAPNVWDSDYKAVYHMSQVPGGAGSIKDSTINANNATPVDAPAQIAGKIGNAINFNGNDALDIVDNTGLFITGEITLEAWIKSSDSIGGVVERFQSTPELGYRMIIFSGKIFFGLDTTTTFTQISSNSTINNNVFHYLVSSRNSSNLMNTYIDSIIESPSATLTGTITDASGDGKISQSSDQGFLTGIIDEVRISSIKRTQNWITTQFNNQNAPDSFYTLGVREDI